MNPYDESSSFDEADSLHPTCAVCETMLPDAADGLLSEAEQRAFDTHVSACHVCARELAEAQRGAAWLSMLKVQTPAPPESLLAKILAETTGATKHVAMPAAPPIASPTILPPAHTISAAPLTAPRPTRVVPSQTWATQWAMLRNDLRNTFSIESRRTTFQPRIAMTAAMAFFSIALTLNLTGVHLRDLRPSNFTPSAVKRIAANIDASATRTFQNNRAVYQLESRLSELRSDDAPGNPAPDSR